MDEDVEDVVEGAVHRHQTLKPKVDVESVSSNRMKFVKLNF